MLMGPVYCLCGTSELLRPYSGALSLAHLQHNHGGEALERRRPEVFARKCGYEFTPCLPYGNSPKPKTKRLARPWLLDPPTIHPFAFPRNWARGRPVVCSRPQGSVPRQTESCAAPSDPTTHVLSRRSWRDSRPTACSTPTCWPTRAERRARVRPCCSSPSCSGAAPPSRTYARCRLYRLSRPPLPTRLWTCSPR